MSHESGLPKWTACGPAMVAPEGPCCCALAFDFTETTGIAISSSSGCDGPKLVFAGDARNGLDQLVRPEAEGACFAQRAPGDVADACALRGKVRGHRLAVADEGAAPAPARQHAFAFEVGICAVHRIRIDLEIDRHFADGGQLVAGTQLPARDRVQDLLLDL